MKIWHFFPSTLIVLLLSTAFMSTDVQKIASARSNPRTWVLDQRLVPSTPMDNGDFGDAVAIEGMTALV
ncbi:MAG TPA: hypothetical protein VHL11_04745, partial [Phototrophicaceae bacterium]|nr:hypothetical protein [Phototrophicaceae bacterium]